MPRHAIAIGFIVAALASAAAASPITVPVTSRPYLDDANGPSKADPTWTYPRIMLTETQSFRGPSEQYAKYDVVGSKPSTLNLIANLQRINPALRFHLAFSPRAYQGYSQADPCSGALGLPFNETGPSTQGCSIYAGHWLYQAGTATTAPITATATVLNVSDARALVAGRYVVIYDAPAGSFKNAEHAQILGVDPVRKTVILRERGYKSVPVAHGAGAIVAPHDLGQGAGEPKNWAFNMTTWCPKDANGNTAGGAIGRWLSENHRRNARGDLVNGARVDGIYFDADAYFIGANKVDANNDLIVDEAMSPDGVNVWGKGMDVFYRDMRARFPAWTLAAGSRRSRGFESLNGTQMEGWPVSGGYEAPKPSYDGAEGFDSVFQRYNVHMRHHQATPAYVENLSKTPTRLYPRGAETPATNAAFRFAFASTLLDDGYYGQQNHDNDPDPWYDEYAVDATPGSDAYGHAIPANDLAAILKHKGWLGRALGVRARLSDTQSFLPAKSLANATLDTDLGGWSAANLALSRDTATPLDGSGALRVSRQLRFDADSGLTSVTGPNVRLEKGKTYTVAFAAKSSAMRDMVVRLANARQLFLIPETWTRIVFTVTPEATADYRLKFVLDKENTEVGIDSVYVLEGNANLFWREFEHGAVAVNASNTARTVAIGEGWQRIKGTGQDPVNDGKPVSSLTLPAWDAAILVRTPTR